MFIQKIIDMINGFFSSKKLIGKKYFDENSKEFDFPSMKTNASILKGISGEVNLGKFSKKSKIDIPNGTSQKLVQLDQQQLLIANTINSLPKEEREKEKKKYLDILFRMFELASKDQPNENMKNESDNLKNTNVQSTNNRDLKQYLEDRHFKTTALPDNLSINQGYIIWPVALLKNTTFIHKAQAQLIKLLTDSGWKLLVIVGDCGKNSTLKDKSGFIYGIKKIIKSYKIQLEDKDVACISDYYVQDESKSKNNLIEGITGTKILKSFHNISEGLIWDKFNTLIKKNYDEPKKMAIEKRTVLNNLQPLLIWSLVATIVKESNSKAIVIAGEDEKEQWDYVTDNHADNNLGVIYIHELTKEDDKTMVQEDLLIRNKQEMHDKLSIGNMAEWLYTHFVELPKFTRNEKPNFCKISDNVCNDYNNNCIDCLFHKGKNFNNQDFDKNKFVNTIYPLSNPANQ